MSDRKVKFLPFHAINEFMLDEYRQLVISSVFEGFSQLSLERQTALQDLVRKQVRLPGFRDANRAPVPLKIRGMGGAFQNNSQTAAQILAGWAELRPELAAEVYDLLGRLGWKVLPLEADRSRLPGFLTTWPKSQEFEQLIAAYREAYPEGSITDDDISLMIVWISGRLPVDFVENIGDDQP